jgi:hypothetical protein
MPPTPRNAYPDLSGVYEVTRPDATVIGKRAIVWRTPGTHDAYTLLDENLKSNEHTGVLKEDGKPSSPSPSKRFLLVATNGTAVVSVQGSPVLVFPGPVVWRRL